MRSWGAGGAAVLPQGSRCACAAGRSRVLSSRVFFGVPGHARGWHSASGGLPLPEGRWGSGVVSPVPVESIALQGASYKSVSRRSAQLNSTCVL